jgi:uncharacterized protein YjbI with pentapeptide repeats
MSTLMLEKDLRNEEDSEVRTLARARTLTVLRRLEPRGKGDVVQFLYEAGLIKGTHPVISLYQADLFEADLSVVRLSDANLRGAYLRRADLRYANLDSANLINANLFAAYLRGADLSDARLDNARLDNADLRNANLRGVSRWTDRADLQKQLKAAFSLEGATMEGGQTYQEWLKDK